MEETFDFREASSQILMRMSRYRLKNVWLMSQLQDAGIPLTSSMFSKIIRNAIQTDKARQVLETCDKILDDYERLFLDEMKKSREDGLSPSGPGLANEKESEIGGQNLPAENLDIEDKQENEIFEYEGYHFEPIGTYEESENEGFWRACIEDVYVPETFMENEPGTNPLYMKDYFYACAGISEDVNLFRCIETEKILVAGENSLFVYDDFVREDGKYTPYNKNSKDLIKSQSQSEETIIKPIQSGLRRRGR